MKSYTRLETRERDGSRHGDAVRRVTYIGNFLSVHGLNPTYAEALVPQLRSCGFEVVACSSRLNGLIRFLDMIRTVVGTPNRGACVIIDLYSGPRAFDAAVI